MHMLLFEVTPAPDRLNEYLDIASRLKVELDRAGGCLFIERFRSLEQDGRILSYQLWESAEAITNWRTNRSHLEVQRFARSEVFADYRLRVARVLAAGEPLPGELSRLVAVSQSAAPYLRGGLPAGCALQSFASVYRQGHFAHVINPGSADRETLERFCSEAHPEQCHVGEVLRDYGMFERREAPQDP